MSIELEVKWDGDVEGLSEHRLSVAAFAGPLDKLLRAIRRRASNIVRDATGQGETSRGRLTDEASRIDIEIESIVRGSGGFAGQVVLHTPPHGQTPLLMDLPRDSMERVLEDLEKEAVAVPRDSQVRHYLKSLPPSIDYQNYRLSVDGQLIKEVTLGPTQITELVSDLPYLVEQTGPVIAAGFDPGRRWIRIKARESGSEVSIDAQDRWVDRAMELRASGDVRVLYLDSGGVRKLLRIQGVNERRPRLNVDEFVFNKWRNVLEVLAQ